MAQPTVITSQGPALARPLSQVLHWARKEIQQGFPGRYAHRPEVENGNIILYRTHNFFLRTAYRPGHRSNPLRRPTGHTIVMPRVLPDQEKRIAASETRVMPNVTLNTTRQTGAIPMPSWVEAI